MKKKYLLCTLCLCLTLSACGKPKAPLQTATGESWNSDWVMVSKLLGAEIPADFKEIRNEGVVTTSQTSYAVWAKGEAQKYTNTEDREITTYDAQIHLLVEECSNSSEAAQHVASWDAVASDRYTFTREWTGDYEEQSFSLMEYDFPEDGGPLSFGASASGVHGCYAIHVDVIALDGEAPAEILEKFLSGFHYAE